MENRKNSNKEYVYIPISFEYLMTSLFGKINYHGYVGSVTLKTWKKDMLKVARYINKSIKINHNGDSYHRNMLLSISENMINNITNSNSINNINIALIEKLIKLVFGLLGHMPNHWERKKPYLDRFWVLSGHRTLNYNQSVEQKAYMILYLVDTVKLFTINFEDFGDMHGVFYRKFKGNHFEFVNWFKKKYSDKYCEIF